MLQQEDLGAMFAFLRSIQYIQYDARFHSLLWRYVQRALDNPAHADQRESLLKLQNLVEHLLQERKARISPGTRVLGRGGYGCVIEPALPNYVGKEWIEHPKNVTKLFKDSTFQKKAVSDAAKIVHVLQNDSYIATPQVAYQASNFRPNIQSECRLSPNSYAYALRMPNAGISIADLQGHEATLATLPVQTILEQCTKLFQQVQMFLDNNTVHGDLHAGNVMVHPETGVFTMIDFDWYLPKDEFFHKYAYANGFGHHTNPPESLLMFPLKDWILLQTGTPSMDSPKMDPYLHYANAMYFRKALPLPIWKADIYAANMDNFLYAETRVKPILKVRDFFDAMFPTFDSYGLAQSLLDVCTRIYPYRKGVDDFPQTAHLTNRGIPYSEAEHKTLQKQLKYLYDRILLPMIDMRLERRLRVEQAIARLQVDMPSNNTNNARKTLRRSKRSLSRNRTNYASIGSRNLLKIS